MDSSVSTPITERAKISVRDLNFYYGGFQALKKINLDLPEKKVTAFIGPSGCLAADINASCGTARGPGCSAPAPPA